MIHCHRWWWQWLLLLFNFKLNTSLTQLYTYSYYSPCISWDCVRKLEYPEWTVFVIFLNILLIRCNRRDSLPFSVKQFTITPECYLHVSILLIFSHLLSNFKYSLHALSTIAYKHLEITASLWADRKRERCSEVIKCGLEPTVFVDGLCTHYWSGGRYTQGINYLCTFFIPPQQLKVVSHKQ